MARITISSVFIDSSVLYAACKSRYGASAQILAYCKRQKIKGYISLHVMTEVRRNISNESDHKVKQRLNNYLLESKLKLVEATSAYIEKCKRVINDRDAPILAAALNSGVDMLATLDKKDFFQLKVREFIHPVQIVTPKDVLNLIKH